MSIPATKSNSKTLALAHDVDGDVRDEKCARNLSKIEKKLLMETRASRELRNR